jgi:N-methylhydantoinase A
LGGQRPTITDANLVLGYLNPNFFNGGAMTLNVEAAKAGIARDIGEPLELDIDRAAWGIHAVANANMEKAMRIVSVERGRDPRRYSLVAFGGAGPVHAARLAKSIGIPKVVVPFGAGVGSAIGLLRAEPKIDTSITRVLEVVAESHSVIAEIYLKLKEQADRDLHRLGVEAVPNWSRYGYLRYQGQGYEIRVDLPLLPINDGYPDAVCRAFHGAYARNYGYHDELATIEAVDWHLVATLETPEATLDLGWHAPGESTGDAGKRPVWFPEQGTFIETAIHDRSRLGDDRLIDGPAIVEDPEATIVVPPNMSARVSRQGHIVINTGVDV